MLIHIHTYNLYDFRAIIYFLSQSYCVHCEVQDSLTAWIMSF